MDLVGVVSSGRRDIFDSPASADDLELGPKERGLCAGFSGRRGAFGGGVLVVVADVRAGVGDVGWATRSGLRASGIFDGEGFVAIFDLKCDLNRDGVRKTGKSCTCYGQDADLVDSIGRRVPLCLCFRASAFGTSRRTILPNASKLKTINVVISEQKDRVNQGLTTQAQTDAVSLFGADRGWIGKTRHMPRFDSFPSPLTPLFRTDNMSSQKSFDETVPSVFCNNAHT